MPYSRTALDITANRILMLYNSQLINGPPSPLPASEILEYNFGIKIVSAGLSADKRTLGKIVLRTAKIELYDNNDHPYSVKIAANTMLAERALEEGEFAALLRFTLCNGIAYRALAETHLLREGMLKSETEACDITLSKSAQSYLCGVLLMPYGQLKRSVFRLTEQGIYGRELISKTAEVFGVPEETARRRLAQARIKPAVAL